MLNFIKLNKWLISGIMIYFILFSFLSLWRHQTFQTQTWDLAVFEQSFYNTLKGHLMFNNFEGTNHLAVHFSPFLLLLVPVYALWAGPEILLILQSLAIALGALPLYLLAKQLINQKWAIVITMMYWLYPSLHWINLFDFHEVPFAIPLFLGFFYFWENNKTLPATILLILAASTAENMIVAVFFVGVFVYLSTRRYFGLGIALISLVYFTLVAKVIMPALGGGIVRLDRYAQFGSSAGEIIKNVIFNPALTAQTVLVPEKLSYLISIFMPVAFLPLAAWPSIILLIPGLLQNLLTTFSNQFEKSYQYDSILIPFMFIGVILAIKYLVPKKVPEKLALTTIAILMSLSFILNSPLSPLNFPVAKFFNRRTEDFKKIIRLIPQDASVAAHTNLIPHLTHREHVYMAGQEKIFVDYVILDVTDPFGFPDESSFNNYLKKYAEAGRHELVVIDNRYYLLKLK